MSNLELIKNNTSDIRDLTNEIKELKDIAYENRGDISTLKQSYDIDEIKEMKGKMTENNILLKQHIKMHEEGKSSKQESIRNIIAVSIAILALVGTIIVQVITK